MTFLDLFALVLAAHALLNAWFDPDSILADIKASTEAWPGLLGRLLGCRFCLSFHVWLLVLILYAPSLLAAEEWAVAAKLPLYSLAVTGLLHLLSALLEAKPLTSGLRSTGPDFRDEIKRVQEERKFQAEQQFSLEDELKRAAANLEIQPISPPREDNHGSGTAPASPSL